VTEQEWDQQKDRELDASLTALFKSVDPPRPRSGFSSRTMKAVRREKLPLGRRHLRHPWIAPAGWATLAAAASVVAAMALYPVAAPLLTSVLAFGVRAGLDLVRFATAVIGFAEPFATASRAMLQVFATREGVTFLLLVFVTGALSLSALRRLLDGDFSRARL